MVLTEIELKYSYQMKFHNMYTKIVSNFNQEKRKGLDIHNISVKLSNAVTLIEVHNSKLKFSAVRCVN